MTGALLAAAPVAPVVAGIVSVALYVRPVQIVVPGTGWELWTDGTAPLAAPLLILTLTWLVLAAVVWMLGFTSPQRVSAGTYGEYDALLHELEGWCETVREPGPWVDSGRAELWQASMAALRRQLRQIRHEQRHAGARWVLGTGYITLWQRLHRAQEALVDVEPPAAVINDARYDILRLQNSSIKNHDAYVDVLRSSIEVLTGAAGHAGAGSMVRSADVAGTGSNGRDGQSPPAAEPGTQQGAPTSALLLPRTLAEVRAVVRVIRRTIGEFRDNSRAGLVRARNRLAVTVGITSLTAYVFLCLTQAMLALKSPSGLVPSEGAERIATGLAYYLIGAVVGLFNRLYTEANSEAGVDDFGLSFTRLLAAPLLAGIAAVLGVVVTFAAAAQVADGEAPARPILDAFDSGKSSLNVLVAAAFGLTPGMLIDRLTRAGEAYARDLKSSQSPSRLPSGRPDDRGEPGSA